LGAQFNEANAITIAREHSLENWLCDKPSRCDMIRGGWIKSDTEDHSKCPHCHMQYYNWKSDDNPWLIHQHLSPLCLFILSPNPFNSNRIPIRKPHEQFTDEDIENAESQPYTGLVQSRHESHFLVTDRRNSFNRFPGGCPSNADELATSGFYYTNRGGRIKCFYCERRVLVWNPDSQSSQYFKHLHLPTQCRYMRQMNDHDPESSSQSGQI
jgi:baculoviral IAP repeat-containing protein 7/8